MKSCRRSLIVSVLIAFAFLLQIAPAIAGPAPGAADKDKDKDDRRAVEFTYTKWITTPLPAPLPWMMEGFVNDGANGSFVGEVFERNVTTNPHITLGITKLEAVYEVIDGDRSFTALMQGGTNNQTGAALLEGVILAGWRTGDHVHVEFQTLPGCLAAPTGFKCFQGTIRVERAPKE